MSHGTGASTAVSDWQAADCTAEDLTAGNTWMALLEDWPAAAVLLWRHPTWAPLQQAAAWAPREHSHLQGRLFPTTCSRLAAGRMLCRLLAVLLLCLHGHTLLLSRLLLASLGSGLLGKLGLGEGPVDSHCSASQLLQHSLPGSSSIGTV